MTFNYVKMKIFEKNDVKFVKELKNYQEKRKNHSHLELQKLCFYGNLVTTYYC